MKILSNPSISKWRVLLEYCGAASIYHTPEWKEFLENALNLKSCYLFSEDENGKIVGMLPLVYMKSRLSGDRLCSLPFSYRCGVIGSPSSYSHLISKAINLSNESTSHALEIRDYIDSEYFIKVNSFSYFGLDLSIGLEAVSSKLKRDAKRGIKRSIDKGINVEKSNNMGDLREYYELNCLTKREKGVPCHSWSFFKNMKYQLGDYFSLYLGKEDGNTIGGGVTMNFKDTALFGYSASHPKMSDSFVNHAIIWRIITDGIERGYRYLDLGRVSPDNKGLIHFKTKWGATEFKLHYSYFPKQTKPMILDRATIKYRLATDIIRLMPVPIYKKFSDASFYHFG
jgi:hypothetical protein